MVKKQGGFTLLEIFIALAIGLVLIGGVLSVFVGMKTTTQETSSMGELQENGRFAMSILTDDLMRQDFWGQLNHPMSSDALTIPAPVTPAGDCVGGGGNNGSFPQNNNFNFRTLWASNVIGSTILGGCITNAAIGSDVLQVKRVISRPALPANLANNRFYLNAGYDNAAIFAGNAAIPPVANGGLWEYQHHIYYIRNDSVGSSGDVVPVLMQGRLQNTLIPIAFNLLVEGIERVNYMFGVDVNGNGVVNGYMTPANMTNGFWDSAIGVGNVNGARILSVKVYVLVRSVRQYPNYENKNKYQMGDTVFDAGGDNYKRLLFSLTVFLYNEGITQW